MFPGKASGVLGSSGASNSLDRLAGDSITSGVEFFLGGRSLFDLSIGKVGSSRLSCLLWIDVDFAMTGITFTLGSLG